MSGRKTRISAERSTEPTTSTSSARTSLDDDQESDSLTDHDSQDSTSSHDYEDGWEEGYDELDPSDSASATQEFSPRLRPVQGHQQRIALPHQINHPRQLFYHVQPSPPMSIEPSDDFSPSFDRGYHPPMANPNPCFYRGSNYPQSHGGGGGFGMPGTYNQQMVPYGMNPFSPQHGGVSDFGYPRGPVNGFEMMPYGHPYPTNSPGYGLGPPPPHYIYPAPPPPAEAPSAPPRPPTAPPTAAAAAAPPDKEKEEMRRQLEKIRLDQEKIEAVKRAKELEEQIRRDAIEQERKNREEEAKQKAFLEKLRREAQESFDRKLAQMRQEQEQAEEKVRQKIEQERRDEAERKRVLAEEMARVEREARLRYEAEIKIQKDHEAKLAQERAAIEAEARLKAQLAIKAEEEAKEAARKKLQEEAAERKRIEEAAKVVAEIAARKKLEDEKAAAEAVAAAEAAAKKEKEDFEKKALAEAMAKAAEAHENAKKAEKPPIKFKDAVGRKFSFPFHLCQTWTGMEELIKQAFLHVEVIGPHVQEGHYDLIGPNSEIILPAVWEKVIEPDWSITMHMWPMDKAPLRAHPSAAPIGMQGAQPSMDPRDPRYQAEMARRRAAEAGVGPMPPGVASHPGMRPGMAGRFPGGAAGSAPPPPGWGSGMRPGSRPGGAPMSGSRIAGRVPAAVVDAVHPKEKRKNKGSTSMLGWMAGSAPKKSSKKKGDRSRG